jgi:hypothetical protein
MFNFEKLDVWQRSSEHDFQTIYAESEQIGRMLSGLRSSLINK